MKLAIAAALAHHPQLLILDEATSGLDPVMRDEMLDVFLEFVQEENHSILLSSHITSDLEKVADYITFIHNGKLIMTVSKNDLVYNYAVMRCKESQFLALDPKDILAYRKRDFQIDVLVSSGKEAQRKYKGVVIDHVSVDEILLRWRGTKRGIFSNQLALQHWNYYGTHYSHKYLVSNSYEYSTNNLSWCNHSC